MSLIKLLQTNMKTYLKAMETSVINQCYLLFNITKINEMLQIYPLVSNWYQFLFAKLPSCSCKSNGHKFNYIKNIQIKQQLIIQNWSFMCQPYRNCQIEKSSIQAFYLLMKQIKCVIIVKVENVSGDPYNEKKCQKITFFTSPTMEFT